MKRLLQVTTVIEGGFGLGLAIVPSLIVPLLLGTSLTDPTAILMGRLAGVVLITVGIACWMSAANSQSSVMVKAMLVYNILSIALLVYAALAEKISGPGLWPAVVLHFALLLGCVLFLRKPEQKRN